MKKIIILNGSGGVGKDVIVSNARRILYDKNINVYNFSSVEPVKHLGIIMGWNGETKNKEVRKFLSDLKALWVGFNDGPFNHLQKRINTLQDNNCIIFVHVREIPEIERIVNTWKDVVTLLVRRPGIDKFDNLSDSDVENYGYDYILENIDGLEELRLGVMNFLEDLKLIGE